MRRFASAIAGALATAASACAPHHDPGSTPAVGAHVAAPSTSSGGGNGPGPSSPPGDHGPALEFILDPVLKDAEWTPASEQLRGKRAVVVVITTWDGTSLALFRDVAPVLRDLPADTTCLLVAMQPLGDRPLVDEFFSIEETPCLRAIGDPARGRLGDLAKVNVIPTTVVLRADGSTVGAAVGRIDAKTLWAAINAAAK